MKNGIDSPGPMIDLGRSVLLLCNELSLSEQKAAAVLIDEIEKRTNLRWRIVPDISESDGSVIVLGQADQVLRLYSQDPSLRDWAQTGVGGRADGFQIHSDFSSGSKRITILGNDARGVLFGAGYLLRQLEMLKGSVRLAGELNITTAPHYPLRGHQLGYRDKTNSYDGWDLAQWDQYIRELAVFGTNAIELIPPRSDDAADSVHFPLPPLDMMEGMSRIADSYDLDVWIWYPAMDDDYSRPEMVEFALREWEAVYKRLPRIDAILVPGGDPGNTRPRYLLPMLEKQAGLLRSYHPAAQLWVSAQGFNREWMDEFLSYLQDDSPDWLSGVVYGPWIHMTIAEFRKLIPARYPIRSYPDITHSLDCQYPVPEWDLAYVLTEGRETINPRPVSEEIIFHQMGEDVIGFLTYSEGCNDDVNKFIWSGLGWDPEADVFDLLVQYSRFFIGAPFEHDFALGLLALEHNWTGPLAANDGVPITLAQFQAMEKRASPMLLKNWRFQQALYRAYYDAFTRGRLLYENGLEEQAGDALRQAERVGTRTALDLAETILDQAVTRPILSDWRTRIYQLAEALFQSVAMQLSVALYSAQSETRGANLDGLDYPLNDRPWLKDQFARIRALAEESERLAEIGKVLSWRDPGPGGYYADLSNAYDCPYIEQAVPYAEDPGFYRSPHRRFPYWKNPAPIRRSWRGYTGALNEMPFRLHFAHLDPQAHYRLRVVYSDTEEEIKIRLVANEMYEIHPFILKEFPIRPLEFDIPWEATRAGDLRLALSREPGYGGLGAGHEISEIWILKKES